MFPKCANSKPPMLLPWQAKHRRLVTLRPCGLSAKDSIRHEAKNEKPRGWRAKRGGGMGGRLLCPFETIISEKTLQVKTFERGHCPDG
jgi:hypothetical protein